VNANVQAEMREASRLVGLGRLLDATATIQRALAGVHPDAPSSQREPRQEKPPLEGTFSVIKNSESDPATSPAAGGSANDRPAIDFPPRRPPVRPEPQHRPARRNGFEESEEADSGAQFIGGSYTSFAGTRRYKLFVPSGYSGLPVPLVVMLHGCTQSPDDAAAGTGFNRFAEERGWLVLYPEQSQSANRQKCWNWFRVSDQHRNGGESALLAGMTREIMTTYAVDTRRVYAVGLSAGGAMAAVLGATQGDLFAAIGIHSGLAYRSAHDLPSALAAMHGGISPVTAPQQNATMRTSSESLALPTIVFHGDRDTTVSPANGDRIIAQCASALSGETKLRVTLISGQVLGGHAYSQRVYEDATGTPLLEHWLIHGAAHAWSGGSLSGSYTDPHGPSATQEMMRFFAAHSRARPND